MEIVTADRCFEYKIVSGRKETLDMVTVWILADELGIEIAVGGGSRR